MKAIIISTSGISPKATSEDAKRVRDLKRSDGFDAYFASMEALNKEVGGETLETDFNTLNELISFIRERGQTIINVDGEVLEMEIYDGYRE